MTEPASLITLFNTAACLGIGLLALSRHPRPRANINFFLFNVCLVLIGVIQISRPSSLPLTHPHDHITLAGLLLLNLTFVRFVASYIPRSMGHRGLLLIFYLANGFMLFYLMVDTLSLGTQVMLRWTTGPTARLFLEAYIAFWVVTALIGLFGLMRSMGVVAGPRRRHHAHLIIGFTAVFLGAGGHWLPWLGMPFGLWPALLLTTYVLTMAHGILRDRLMDADLVSRWNLAYAISFVGVLAGCVSAVIVMEAATTALWPAARGVITVLSACVAALFFTPVRERIGAFVDRLIFKSPDFRLAMHGIQEGLQRAANITQLAEDLSREMTTIWKTEYAGMAAWVADRGTFSILGHHHIYGQRGQKTNPVSLGPDNFLVRTLAREKRLFKNGVVTDAEISNFENRAYPGEKATFGKIRRSLRVLGATACVPLFSEDHLTGFLFLGKKRGGTDYTHEDKKSLAHVAELASHKFKTLLAASDEPNQSLPDPAFQADTRVDPVSAKQEFL